MEWIKEKLHMNLIQGGIGGVVDGDINQDYYGSCVLIVVFLMSEVLDLIPLQVCSPVCLLRLDKNQAAIFGASTGVCNF